MKVDRKMVLAKSAIASISRHDDETKEVVLGALAELVAFIKTESDAFIDRKGARDAAAMTEVITAADVGNVVDIVKA